MLMRASPHGLRLRAAATKSEIICALFMPGAVSTPDDTSTPGAPLHAIARATLSAFKPPASSHGFEKLRPRSNCQSNAAPCPPGTRGARGRLGIEQQHVAHRLVARGIREIGSFRDRDRFDDPARRTASARAATRSGVSLP